MNGEHECDKCGIGCFDDGGKECHCPRCGTEYSVGKKGVLADTGLKLMKMAVQCGHLAPECIVLKNGDELCFDCAMKKGHSIEEFKSKRIDVYHKLMAKMGHYHRS